MNEEENKASGSTELTLRSSELGPAILKEAKKRYNQEQQDCLLKDVQRLMTNRDESLRQERHYRYSAEWFARKLKALNDGAFKFDELTVALVFDDPDLQRANY